MAKKRTEKKAKSFSEAIGLQYIFNNTITDFFIGLALIAVAVVIIIAMVSFLRTGAADQSILENLRPGEWTNEGQQFQNYCGSLGAIISYWLIALNFGFPAFLLPCFIIMVGLQQGEPLEVVLLPDGGDVLVILHLRQVPHSAHGQSDIQSWRKAWTLRGTDTGKRDRSSGTHRHPALRSHRLPHLSYHGDHHRDQKGAQPYRIYI